ncbi:MAG: hypothetical protein N2039_09800, partial [Gemmataceae bacterium]|nr:hypothetical protein [Gemmataceae bacterium]
KRQPSSNVRSVDPPRGCGYQPRTIPRVSYHSGELWQRVTLATTAPFLVSASLRLFRKIDKGDS